MSGPGSHNSLLINYVNGGASNNLVTNANGRSSLSAANSPVSVSHHHGYMTSPGTLSTTSTVGIVSSPDGGGNSVVVMSNGLPASLHESPGLLDISTL